MEEVTIVMDGMDGLTCPQKRYLLAVYQLSLAHGAVKITELARAVGVGKSSATCMTAKLAEHGYLDKAYYGQIVLTEKGRVIAKSIFQRTELFRSFLTEQLSVDAACAADDAAAIAVYVSENTVEQLSRFLQEHSE